METLLQFKTIEEYYNFMDSKNFDLKEIGNTIAEVNSRISELEEMQRNKILLEIECLNIQIRNGSFPQHLPENTLENFDIPYIENRIKNLKNEYLKAHFAHILWYKYKKYEYSSIAIDSYFKLIEKYRQLDIDRPQETFGIEICYILGNLEHLTFSLKTKIDDFVKLLLDLIHNPNRESSCFNKLTLDCFNILIDKHKKLDKNIFNGLENICENIVQGDLNSSFMTAYLKVGLEISKITKTDPNKWILKEAEYFEELAEKSDGNLISPQYCQKAISLYKELKMPDKVNEMYKKYESLTKNIKLSVYESEGVNIKPYLEQFEKLAEENSSEKILDYLVLSPEVIPNYQVIKKSAENLLGQDPSSLICSTFIIDEHGNKIESCDTDEKNLQRLIDGQYDTLFELHSKSFFFLFKKAFELKKLNSEIIISYLKKTWFGVEQKEQLSTGDIYTYSWIDFIEESITSFIDKFENSFKVEENVKYRFIQEIDSLSSKIEGIIRDIGRHSNLEEFRAFKFDNDDNYQLNNINKYLYDSSIAEVIEENDLQFFKYFLIDRRNLRNRVAHCMMLKSEYNFENMMMLLFVVFRLSKYLQVRTT